MASSTFIASGAPRASTPSAVPRGPTVAVGLLALAFGHLAVDSCSGIWPIFKTLAGLDLAWAGLVATIAGMSGNILQLLFGFLADRGLRRAVLVTGIAASGAVAAVSLTTNATWHVVLVTLAALGSGAFHPTAAGAAGSMGGARKGVFVALFLAGGYAGYGFSQLAFATLYQWTPALTLVLAGLPLLAALANGVFPPPLVTPAAGGVRAWATSIARALPRLSPLFAIQLLSSAAVVSVVFLLPDLLLARAAPYWMVAGGAHAAFVLGGCASLLPSGHLADRYGARTVLVISNVLAGIALAGLLGWGHGVASLGLVAAFGFFSGANNVVVVAEGTRLFPDRAAATSAILMGLPWCLASLSPAVAGLLATPDFTGSPAVTLGIMGLAMPATAVLATRLPRAT